MTIDEFLDKLAQTPAEWSEDERGQIRLDGACPICAVAGGTNRISFWKVAPALGLSVQDANVIADTADNATTGLDFSAALRPRLLAVTVNRTCARLTYSTPKPRPARKPKGPTARRITKRKRAESLVIKSVRAKCVERDVFCRYDLDEFAKTARFGTDCKGPSEWAHLENYRRSKTRNMAPELRHTTAGTAMLCKFHHDCYDGRGKKKLRIVNFGALGADGPLTWTLSR